MIKLLPFIVIPVLILSVLGYWQYSVNKQALTTPQSNQQNTEDLIEVPKTLPATTIEDRSSSLENTVKNLVSPSPQSKTLTSSDSRFKDIDAAIADLKSRLSVLEKATPAAPLTSTSRYPLYIPLGSGGGPWGNTDWHKLDEYTVILNSEDYVGYSSMQLEVNFRLAEPTGKGSVRLYNVTDQAAVSPQVDNSTATFSTQASGTFKLASGQKTYTLQMKSTEARSLFIQSARIKVNF